MPDTATDAVDEPPPLYEAPVGHSRAGHRVHGWCSVCPDREVWEELVAWRARENRANDEADGIPDRVTPPSKEGERG